MKKIVFLIFIFSTFISCENNEIITIEKTLIIASQKADCIGVAPQKCLLVKESTAQNWEYFYSSISGFSYTEGFEYEVIVSEKEVENPAQDASSIETTLIEIISKVEKTSENLPI